MYLKSFVFSPFLENTYILYNDNKEAIIIDPGCYEPYEESELVSFIELNNLVPKAIFNTHCHIDHVFGNLFLKQKYNIKLYIPAKEKDMLKAVIDYAPMWGITNYKPCEPDILMDTDFSYTFGKEAIQFIFAPGHSPGHLMFYLPNHHFVIGGDVIFRNSIGRTDLPGGDFKTLENSIINKVYTLPNNTKIYSGHGEVTTVGYEKEHNPFVKIKN